jgi:multiple RNA-binding domain-containing protein 1
MQVFSPYGPLQEVHIVKDRATHVSKGFAYVLFDDPQVLNVP